MHFYRLARLILLAQLIFFGSLTVSGKTLTFDQEQVHVDVPDAWTEKSVAGIKVYLINPDHTKAFGLQIVATPRDFTIDSPSPLDRDKKGATGNGRTVIDQKRGTLAGVEARILDFSESAPSDVSYARETIVIANGYAYALTANKINSPPWQDDELNTIVSSFGFTGIPELHHQGRTDKSGIGYLVAAVGVGVMFLAILVFFTWMRRRN